MGIHKRNVLLIIKTYIKLFSIGTQQTLIAIGNNNYLLEYYVLPFYWFLFKYETVSNVLSFLLIDVYLWVCVQNANNDWF